MTTPNKIELENGKYTLIFDKDGFRALRGGEPWRDMTGDKMILAMMQRIQELEESKPNKIEIDKGVFEALMGLRGIMVELFDDEAVFKAIDSTRPGMIDRLRYQLTNLDKAMKQKEV